MPCRGVRGATTVDMDSAGEILAATRDLLKKMVEVNGIDVADLASAIFTATPDLVSVFPARAARELGWDRVPLLDALEVPVPGGLPRCVRILLHWNTDLAQDQICHVYLRGAAGLRPDLA